MKVHPAMFMKTMGKRKLSAQNTVTAPVAMSRHLSTSRARPLPPSAPLPPGLQGVLMWTLLLATMAWAVARRNQPGMSRWKSAFLPLPAGLLLILAQPGCGGGGGSVATTSNPGTPAGTSSLTVTGTAGSGSSTVSHSVTLTLIVS
jgi:hypothetical protein